MQLTQEWPETRLPQQKAAGSKGRSWGLSREGSEGCCCCSLKRVQRSDPRTVGGQAPWSIGFPRQKYWSGLPFFSQGIFPTQGLNPGLLRCRQILYHPSYQRNQTGKGAMETEEQEGMSKKPMKAPWGSKSSWTLSGRWSQNGSILLMFRSLILFRFRGWFWIKTFFLQLKVTKALFFKLSSGDQDPGPTEIAQLVHMVCLHRWGEGPEVK